jgi:hypothetical protein
MKTPGNNVMLPNENYVQKAMYDTSAAGVFTFIGVEHRDPNDNNIISSFSPAEISITLTNPNGFTLTRTYKPLAMKTALNGEQIVWASVNLYQGSTAAISFTNDFSKNIACTNTVASINLTPRPYPNPPGGPTFRRFPAACGPIRRLPVRGAPRSIGVIIAPSTPRTFSSIRIFSSKLKGLSAGPAACLPDGQVQTALSARRFR